MSVEFMRQLFDWTRHADRRLWDEAIAPLDDALFQHDTGYSLGSLQCETAHVVDVMDTSLQRIQGIKHPRPPFNSDAPPIAVIRDAWDAAETRWQAFMRALDAESFGRRIDVIYRETPMNIPTWQLIFHVINHNTLHRAEMLGMLSRLNRPADPDISPRALLPSCDLPHL